jgi:hypothetical protein
MPSTSPEIFASPRGHIWRKMSIVSMMRPR